MSYWNPSGYQRLAAEPWGAPRGHELRITSCAMTGLLRKSATNQGGGGVRLVPGLDVRAGQTIAGKYRVEELIGHGPSGVVLAARNVHLREQVVLKILASYTDGQEELLQRRLKKARIASRLESAHVARIVDIGVTGDGMPYVATEALDGATLEAELAERSMLPVEEAARWVLEACEGLAEAHASGLVHGDLKPQNIFLARPKAAKAPKLGAENASADGHDETADTRVLKILDFGTTSPLDAIGDQSASAFFGSPAFVAPEQIQSPADVDARADVWALGVLLYNLVSGRLPFEADTLSGVIVAVVYDAPSLLTDAPYELARLVARCLEKDPANRPQDVRELAAALAPFAGSNGARLSERVGAMLDAGSMSPVTIADSADGDAFGAERTSDEPLPLVTLRDADARDARAGRSLPDGSTRPSARVIARRQARTRMATFVALGGAAAIALAGWASTRAASLPSMSAAAPAEVSITSAPVTASVPATKPSELPDAPRASGIDPDATRETSIAAEPEVSFAPGAPDGVTPTPLAVTATPLATSDPTPPTLPFPSSDADALADAPAPAAAPAVHPAPDRAVVLPAPRSLTPASLPNAPAAVPGARVRSAPSQATRATTPLRLPPGLPTSRDGLSPPPRSDETYLRKLISDRK
jgi:serine/threonine protein kinase